MFRRNDQHLQMPLFSSIDSLAEKQQERLEASWAGTFYREVFMRIDERVSSPYYMPMDLPGPTYRLASW